MSKSNILVYLTGQGYDKHDDKDVNLFVHVFDDQQYRTVQASHIPVQSLQAAPMNGCAVDHLPSIALGPGWHVSCKLMEKEVFISYNLLKGLNKKTFVIVHQCLLLVMTN